MFKGEHKLSIPLAVDGDKPEVPEEGSKRGSDDDFGIEKITEEFIKSLESNDGNGDAKFQELVNAMTKKALFEINKLDKKLNEIKDSKKIEEIRKTQENIRANLIKKVSEIEHLSDSYNNNGGKE